MLDVMRRAIHMAIQGDGISYPDQRSLEHVLAAMSKLSVEAKQRIEKCVNTGEEKKSGGPSGGRSVELDASGQLSGGSRGGS